MILVGKRADQFRGRVCRTRKARCPRNTLGHHPPRQSVPHPIGSVLRSKVIAERTSKLDRMLALCYFFIVFLCAGPDIHPPSSGLAWCYAGRRQDHSRKTLGAETVRKCSHAAYFPDSVSASRMRQMTSSLGIKAQLSPCMEQGCRTTRPGRSQTICMPCLFCWRTSGSSVSIAGDLSCPQALPQYRRFMIAHDAHL